MAPFVAEFERGRLGGGLLCRADGGLSDHLNRLFQPMIKRGLAGILFHRLSQCDGVFFGQFAKKQGGEARF